MEPFEVGEIVRLVKPFRWHADHAAWDAEQDEVIRKACGPEPKCEILDVRNDHKGYRVQFVGMVDEGRLLINEDCLAPEGPTNDEIQAAIQSILNS